jgi:hypothetical protein
MLVGTMICHHFVGTSGLTTVSTMTLSITILSIIHLVKKIRSATLTVYAEYATYYHVFLRLVSQLSTIY